MPIRHWDGYWFGGLRLWGDVFPHYWSILSAAIYLDWPEDLAEPQRIAELRSAGYAILRSNLISFNPDGSASCAFVYPSCVNGRPAYVADPLANDQTGLWSTPCGTSISSRIRVRACRRTDSPALRQARERC